MDGNAAENIIDWAAVIDICGSEDIVKEIIELSLEDGLETTESLAEAVKSTNSADVAVYAHKLKGVAMTTGATRLSEVAYRLECAGNEKDIETAALLLEQAKDEFEKVRLFLSRDDWIEKTKQQENSETERELI